MSTGNHWKSPFFYGLWFFAAAAMLFFLGFATAIIYGPDDAAIPSDTVSNILNIATYVLSLLAGYALARRFWRWADRTALPAPADPSDTTRAHRTGARRREPRGPISRLLFTTGALFASVMFLCFVLISCNDEDAVFKLLAPAFLICHVFTPEPVQTPGNLPPGLAFLFCSGIAYAFLGAVLIRLISRLRGRLF